MKKLDLDRPSVLPTEGEFSLFDNISCQKAVEVYSRRSSSGPLALMQLKAHMTDASIDHQAGCPALDEVATSEIDHLLTGELKNGRSESS